MDRQFKSLPLIENTANEIVTDYGKLINTLLEKNEDFSNVSIDQFNKVVKFFLKIFDCHRTKCLIIKLNNEIFEYLTAISYLEDGMLINLLLNEIKELANERIIELLITLSELQINDKEGIKVLSQVCSQLKGQDSLLKAFEIQDNYIKEIIYNRPYFSFQSKICSIANASKSSEGTHVIKYGNIFFNTQKDGNIAIEANKGAGESRALGLFTGDMQFISQYDLIVYDSNNIKLGHRSVCLENNGHSSYDENIYGEFIVAKRKRVVNGGLFEKIELINSGTEKVKINFVISSVIKDIFEIRGKLFTENKPADISITCNGEVLINHVMDSGNVYGTVISACEKSRVLCQKSIDDSLSEIVYEVELNSGDTKCIDIKVQPLLNNHPYVDGEVITDPPSSFEEAIGLIQNSKKTQFAKVRVEGDIPNIQKTVDKCLKDLNMLVSYINFDGKAYSYIDAGLPRYAALFGRDSIVTALQVFPLNQDIARDTLELLAIFQGKTFEQRHKNEIADIKNSNWPEAAKNAALKGMKNFYYQKEEESGKILHELRVGEFALTGQIPHSPYYGTVDATPLWIILYGEYYKWSQDRKFLSKLLPNAEAALEWIESNMENGYLRFIASMHSKVKIQNQGWKDAGDSIRHVVNAKGYLCDPEYPIALAEVQGYVYKAFNIMSEIYNETGNIDKALILKQKGEDLKERFNKDFWLVDEKFYTMALDRGNNPVFNITSNIGHCLSMGIIDNEKTAVIEEKIVSEEMFTGWGIRTLSSKCSAFDPISYHNGSVWVHDSAFVATGLSRESMAKITKGLFEAANMLKITGCRSFLEDFKEIRMINLFRDILKHALHRHGQVEV